MLFVASCGNESLVAVGARTFTLKYGWVRIPHSGPLYLRVIESAVDAVSDVSSNWGTAAGKAKQQEIE